MWWSPVLGSIVVSIPVCHTGDRGSIPSQGVVVLNFLHAQVRTYMLTFHFASLQKCVNLLKVDLNNYIL